MLLEKVGHGWPMHEVESAGAFFVMMSEMIERHIAVVSYERPRLNFKFFSIQPDRKAQALGL